MTDLSAELPKTTPTIIIPDPIVEPIAAEKKSFYSKYVGFKTYLTLTVLGSYFSGYVTGYVHGHVNGQRFHRK